jgi:hypothetical protein
MSTTSIRGSGKPATVVGTKYISRTGKHVSQPKPCPTCYNPMLWFDDHWECEKHGVPTRP